MRVLGVFACVFLLFSCLSDDSAHDGYVTDFVAWAMSDSSVLPDSYSYERAARMLEAASPGGAFFAGAVFEHKGLQSGAELAYRYALEHSSLFYARAFALEALVGFARASGDFSSVAELVREGLSFSGDFSFLAESVFEAWTRTGRGDRAVLEAFLQHPVDSASYAWAAAARAALEDKPDLRIGYYVSVLLNVSSVNIPDDFWLFFKPFSLSESSVYGMLARAVYFSYKEDYAAAVRYYTAYVNKKAPISSVVLYDFYRAYRLYGRLTEGAEYFYSLSENAGDFLYEALDYSARLYRFSGSPRRSSEIWQRILEHEIAAGPLLRNEDRIERAAWYLFANAVRISEERIFIVLSELTEKGVLRSAAGEGLFDSSIFAPELDDYISYLVREKKWYSLINLYSELEFSLSSRHAALLASVILQAAGADFVELTERFAKKLRAVLKDSASDPHVHPYYFLLAYPERNPLDYYTSLYERDKEKLNDEDASTFIKTALSFSFLPDFATWLDRLYPVLSPDTLYNAAASLSLSGDHLDAIRILSDIHDKGKRLSEDAVKELMYPQPYISIASEEAKKRDVPVFLVYGLMREESLFTPAISSHAGAIGLMQLMPETAEDERKRLKMSPGDLNAPGYNIAIGTAYLARLIERFRLPMYALAAYNAGPSRLNLWLDTYSELPPLLWLEALPIRETRHYLRKVLSSSVYYASIYKGRHPRDTLFMMTGTDVVLALHTQGE